MRSRTHAHSTWRLILFHFTVSLHRLWFWIWLRLWISLWPAIELDCSATRFAVLWCSLAPSQRLLYAPSHSTTSASASAMASTAAELRRPSSSSSSVALGAFCHRTFYLIATSASASQSTLPCTSHSMCVNACMSAYAYMCVGVQFVFRLPRAALQRTMRHFWCQLDFFKI